MSGGERRECRTYQKRRVLLRAQHRVQHRDEALTYKPVRHDVVQVRRGVYLFVQDEPDTSDIIPLPVLANVSSMHDV